MTGHDLTAVIGLEDRGADHGEQDVRSSGDTAIEQRPLGRGLVVAVVHVVPPSVDRMCPSSPQRSMMPPWCTTTSPTSSAGSPVSDPRTSMSAPASVLMARPQLVPMKTRFAFAGSMAMPKAAGSDRRCAVRQKLTGGVAVAGWVQVMPPSLLTLIPERLFARPSKNDVA